MSAAEQVEEWVEEIWEKMGNKEVCWSLTQVSCPEEGCPPVEVVITNLDIKGPKPGNGVYKIFKTMQEVTIEDVEAMLKMGSAASCAAAGTCADGTEAKTRKVEGSGGGHGEGHGHGEQDHGEGHKHSGDCCGGGGHGDKEHGAGEGHGGHGGGHGGHGGHGETAHGGGC